jgi:hypothetical protein
MNAIRDEYLRLVDAGIDDSTARESAFRAALKDTKGELLRDTKGAVIPCEHNAFLLLQLHAIYAGVHYDEFLSRMRIDARDWADADDLEAVRWLQSTNGVARFTLMHARNAARSLAYSRRRDSLIEFVESLPAWDGVERIEQAFCDAWGAPENALMRASSVNFFVALIARAQRPGAKVDTLFTFEGPQGKKKSLALESLGGPFYAEMTAAIGSADFMRELIGIWIAELSELDSLRGREASTIKRVLSAPADRFVQKYALHAQSHPRRAVAVATTNEANYWQDATGARRLIPIPCGEIRVDLIAANRLQWFAEARRLHSEGRTWWQFPSGMSEEQDARQQVDPWEDVLRDAIAHGRQVGIDRQGREPWPTGPIASATIMRDWLRLEPHQQGQASGVRLGKVMRRLGFAPARIGHTQDRGWKACRHS